MLGFTAVSGCSLSSYPGRSASVFIKTGQVASAWHCCSEKPSKPKTFIYMSRTLPSSRIWVYCNIPSQMHSRYVKGFFFFFNEVQIFGPLNNISDMQGFLALCASLWFIELRYILHAARLFGLHCTSCISHHQDSDQSLVFSASSRGWNEFSTSTALKYLRAKYLKRHRCCYLSISLATLPLLLFLLCLSQQLFCTTLVQMCVLPPSDHGCRLLPVVLLLK